MMHYAALLLVISSTHAKTPKPQIEIKTSKGTLRLELTPDHTPITVDNFLAYVDASFFDGLTFHRVIKGFMAQGGGFDSSLDEKPALANWQGACLAEWHATAMEHTSELQDYVSSNY